MKVGRSARPSIPPVAPGTYFAVCIGVIDLGEQETIYNGSTKYAKKVQIIFEFPNELVVVDGEERPRWLSRRFTRTDSGKGNLRPFVESWLAKKFSDEDFAEFELFDLVSKPAMLTVVLSEDGQYANIASAAAMPRGTSAPTAKSEFLTFDIDQWDDKQFSKLPEYLQELIKKSTQYKAAHLPQDEVSLEAAEAAAAEAAQAEDPQPSGGVPF